MRATVQLQPEVPKGWEPRTKEGKTARDEDRKVIWSQVSSRLCISSEEVLFKFHPIG